MKRNNLNSPQRSNASFFRNTGLVLGLLLSCSLPVFSQTRLMLGAGGGATEWGQHSDPVFHASVAMDLPRLIRQFIPMDLNLECSLPLDTRRQGDLQVNSGPDLSWGEYTYYNLRFVTAESVRIYGISRHRKDGSPDGMEAGIGIGNYQVVTDHIGSRDNRRIGTRMDAEWGLNAFTRMNFMPTHNKGIFLELDLQRTFSDTNDDFPLTAAMLQVGYRLSI